MSTKLSLIKNLSPEMMQEKVVLPNFPFCYLTFQSDKLPGKTFEVTDVSETGFQLALRAGNHDYKNDQLDGTLHWHGDSLELSAKVMWKTDNRLGLELSDKKEYKMAFREFFSPSRVVANMRPIHMMDLPIELPHKLKYWLKGDGPFDLYVWQHSDGEWSKFQFMMMENYVEWSDGVGMRTGRVFSKRDLKTPLLEEDEFTFMLDEVIDQKKIEKAVNLLNLVEEASLDELTLAFIKRKLS